MEPTLARRRFGKSLAALRRKAELAQWDIAEALSYTTAQFVSNWERGISLPPVDAVPQLAKVFGVSPAGLVKEIYAVRGKELRAEKNAALKAVRRSA